MNLSSLLMPLKMSMGKVPFANAPVTLIEERTDSIEPLFVSREVYGFAETNNGSIESVRSSIKVVGTFANGTLPIDIFNGINKDDKFICHKTAYAKTADSNMISHLISFERK